jgi:chromosome segregation ATPase
MEYDRRYERAMLYVFGETLVFDTLDEARNVCLKQSQRYQSQVSYLLSGVVNLLIYSLFLIIMYFYFLFIFRRRGVTLDGTKIDKSGVMTGGISGVEQKAARYPHARTRTRTRTRTHTHTHTRSHTKLIHLPCRWDQQQLDELKKQREKYERELLSVSRQRLSDRLHTLTGEIQGLTKASQVSSQMLSHIHIVDPMLTKRTRALSHSACGE